MANFSDTASEAVQAAGRDGRQNSGELTRSAESAAVSAADKIVREARADGKLDSTEKAEAKKAAEKAAKDKVEKIGQEAATQTAPGQFTVQQGDSVWGALRQAGYSDKEINSGGLINQVAQASGLANPNLIRPGDVLTLPTRDGAQPGPGRQLNAGDLNSNPQLQEAFRVAAQEAGLPSDVVAGNGSSAQSELVPGSNDMRQGTLTLRDPNSGEVLGTYDFNNGGFGLGSIPNGTYEVSGGYMRNDKSGMISDGVGYSFVLTQEGMAAGTADDPRYGTDRSLLRIHPDGNNAGTEGCIGIIGNAEVQRAFYEQAQALAAANGGAFTLEFG